VRGDSLQHGGDYFGALGNPSRRRYSCVRMERRRGATAGSQGTSSERQRSIAPRRSRRNATDGDVFALARIAGHSSIAITQRYAHTQADTIEGIFNRAIQDQADATKATEGGTKRLGVGTKTGTVETAAKRPLQANTAYFFCFVGAGRGRSDCRYVLILNKLLRIMEAHTYQNAEYAVSTHVLHTRGFSNCPLLNLTKDDFASTDGTEITCASWHCVCKDAVPSRVGTHGLIHRMTECAPGHLVLLAPVEMKCRLHVFSRLELPGKHPGRWMHPAADATTPTFKSLFLACFQRSFSHHIQSLRRILWHSYPLILSSTDCI
jgi:hypothetical protein